MKSISILGCGWLGKPLGAELIKSGYEVSGSTTQESKLHELEVLGIKPFLIKLDPQLSSGGTTEHLAFFQADTLITGAYRSNKPVGIWRIFGSHKELELIYNYDSSLVSYFKFPSDENLNYDHINRPPVCMKGFNNLKLLTAINSSFPPDLEQIGKFELNVTVIFNINKQGIPEGFYISDSSGNLTIDKQAFKDIKTSVEKEIWLPALDKSNRPISYNLKLSLKYRVN